MDSPDKPAESDQGLSSAEPSPADVGGILKPVRQLIVFVFGMSVLLVGIAMIVLPGPAIVVIPAGLAILGTEFVWARHLLKYVRRRAQEVVEWSSNSGKPPATK